MFVYPLSFVWPFVDYDGCRLTMDLTFLLTDSMIPYSMQQQKLLSESIQCILSLYFFFVVADIYVSSAKAKHIVLLQYIA